MIAQLAEIGRRWIGLSCRWSLAAAVAGGVWLGGSVASASTGGLPSAPTGGILSAPSCGILIAPTSGLVQPASHALSGVACTLPGDGAAIATDRLPHTDTPVHPARLAPLGQQRLMMQRARQVLDTRSRLWRELRPAQASASVTSTTGLPLDTARPAHASANIANWQFRSGTVWLFGRLGHYSATIETVGDRQRLIVRVRFDSADTAILDAHTQTVLEDALRKHVIASMQPQATRVTSIVRRTVHGGSPARPEPASMPMSQPVDQVQPAPAGQRRRSDSTDQPTPGQQRRAVMPWHPAQTPSIHAPLPLPEALPRRPHLQPALPPTVNDIARRLDKLESDIARIERTIAGEEPRTK